ncbi:MAG: hypothetical protein MK161_09240 [Pirellulales bacterium]|nr:hypothetical protein [Pirellulales bacterium]
MNWRHLSLVVTIGLLFSVGPDGVQAESTSPDKSSPASPDWKKLEKAYASTTLELAQADLAVDEEMIEQVSGTVPGMHIDRLKRRVVLRQRQLKALENGTAVNRLEPLALSCQMVLANSADNLRRLLAANKRISGTIPAVEIRQAEVRVAVAEARLALVKALPKQSEPVRFHWELQILREQLDEAIYLIRELQLRE